MPVGSRSRVWTSQSFRRRLRMVSPAPPSNSTLSGKTMAARPLILSRLRTCWRKLSCLLLVVAQKSSRRISWRSFTSSPSRLIIVTLDFLPLEQHIVGQNDGGAAVDLEQAADVLEEVELFVAGGRPEVVAQNLQQTAQ